MNTKINVIRLQKNTFLLICREITTYVCEERIETNCCITTGVGFFFPSHLPVNGFTAAPLPHNNSFIEVYNAYFILYNRIPPLFKARLLRGRTIICILKISPSFCHDHFMADYSWQYTAISDKTLSTYKLIIYFASLRNPQTNL